jgi:putative flavoprotein involved in K+ transport
MSRCLAERGVDHVVLERGMVANSWRTERWNSLRLLTPNWQSRLPGYGYEGDDPDGYRTMPEVIAFLDRYAKVISAPVEIDTTVTSVQASDGDYRVETNRDAWQCRTVVLAAGACNVVRIPEAAKDLGAALATFTPLTYRHPDQLPAGGVLVVGASATGTQLADEIHRSGRSVTIAVGEHIRAPRVYRGRDIQWWMDAAGVLDERYDQVDDIVRARHVPSPQLVGTTDRSTLDLNALTESGVRLVGRLSAVDGTRALFSGSLRNVCALADLKLARLLDTIDEWATGEGLDGEVGEPERLPATIVEDDPALSLPLGRGGIESVVWATGYRPDYSWLQLPVLDRKGEIRHDGGVVTDSPGLYRIGLNFLRRRKSSFIHGAEDDAVDITQHLTDYLTRQSVSAGRAG